MGLQEAVRSFLKRYADFQGRSSRSEYWWVFLAFFLFGIAASIVLSILMMIARPLGYLGYAAYVLAILALLVPSLSLGFRRLHDTDKSAWWMLIGLVPLLGTIVLLVFYLLPGTPGPNKFGPDPLGQQSAEVFA